MTPSSIHIQLRFFLSAPVSFPPSWLQPNKKSYRDSSCCLAMLMRVSLSLFNTWGAKHMIRCFPLPVNKSFSFGFWCCLEEVCRLSRLKYDLSIQDGCSSVQGFLLSIQWASGTKSFVCGDLQFVHQLNWFLENIYLHRCTLLKGGKIFFIIYYYYF